MTYYLNRGTLLIIPVVCVIFQGLLYLFVVSTFFLASFVDPGIYPRGKSIGGAFVITSCRHVMRLISYITSCDEINLPYVTSYYLKHGF